MGSLKWAAYKQNQKEIAASLDALINLLRFTIKKAGGMVSVAEEIDYIHNYISIEKVKYGERFEMGYEVEDRVKDYLVPGFILQPLVENSLLHGLDMAEENGRIILRACEKSGYLILEVEDNGAGISKEKQEILFTSEMEKKYKDFNSIGLKIVDKRLREIYGQGYHTDVASETGEGARITLNIPLGEIKDEMGSADC